MLCMWRMIHAVPSDRLSVLLRKRFDPGDLFQDPLPDLIQTVFVTQTIKPEITLRSGWPQGRTLQFSAFGIMQLEFISFFLQELEEFPLRQGLPYRIVDIPADHASVGRSAFLFRRPFAVMLSPSLRVLHNRQHVLAAQAVGHFLHLLVIFFCSVEFDPVYKRDGVYKEMIMDMGVFVYVCRDDHFIPVAPEFLCQPDTDHMCQFWRHLSFFKRLIAVICDCPSRFSKALFGLVHILHCCLHTAVDGGHQLGMIGRAIPCHILQDISDRCVFIRRIRRMCDGLFRVLDILKHGPQFSFNPPD